MAQIIYSSNNIDFILEQINIENISQLESVKELVWEYFKWGNDISIEKYGYDFNIKNMLSDFINDIKFYIPPSGRFYLVSTNSKYIGIGGFKKIGENECELKRLYIKEEYRGVGLGRKVLRTLIDNAKDQDYKTIRLESGQFMKTAYNMYKSFGFKETGIYNGTESPEEYKSMIYYMKLEI